MEALRVVYVLIFASFVGAANAQTYRITPAKITGWGISVIGGAADGMVEGYTFDGRTSFERKWNASRYGFWGSESWRMVYRNGQPEQGFKTPLHNWAGAADFYHVADDTRKFGYISGGILIGIGGAKVNTKWWHYAADFGIGFTLSAISKAGAMYWIRN